jgi:hypothetical protein
MRLVTAILLLIIAIELSHVGAHLSAVEDSLQWLITHR